jgi:magnesium transporter
VNLHNQVVGMLTVDAVLEQVKQDSFKQSLTQVGLSEDEDIFAPIWQSGRKRLAWLGVNLFTAFVASRVVGGFEGSIAQLTALAALMPIVASIGGNTGKQTMALVIRGLALSQLDMSNMMFLLRKELAIGAITGALWGVVMALVTLLLYHSIGLAVVMAMAMVLNMLVASAVGVFCPLILERLGRDPVLGSSILLTAITISMLRYEMYLRLLRVESAWRMMQSVTSRDRQSNTAPSTPTGKLISTNSSRSEVNSSLR